MLMALLKFLSPFKFIKDLEQLYKCNVSTPYRLFRHKLILLDKDPSREFLSSVQPIETRANSEPWAFLQLRPEVLTILRYRRSGVESGRSPHFSATSLPKIKEHKVGMPAWCLLEAGFGIGSCHTVMLWCFKSLH